MEIAVTLRASSSNHTGGGYLPSVPARVALVCLLSLCGCATTQAWEREVLADPAMAPDPDPDAQSLRQHVYGVREGAVGGFGGGGGGCGCN